MANGNCRLQIAIEIVTGSTKNKVHLMSLFNLRYLSLCRSLGVFRGASACKLHRGSCETILRRTEEGKTSQINSL